MIWCADIFPITADFNYHPVPHRPLFNDSEGRGIGEEEEQKMGMRRKRARDRISLRETVRRCVFERAMVWVIVHVVLVYVCVL